jgi:CheY-like chemotaxis protein
MRPAKRILVVDDNPTNLEVIHEMLDGDYVVETASDAWEAIRAAERYRPRIVLLDVMLPGVDGYEVCRTLRHMSDMATARIIMLSAKAMPSERAAGLCAGADAYLTKPFDDVDLMAALRADDDDER